ncbi:PspC domain-containing protein [Wansuia hejianensis]|uniref:PspC domain-containing protein n=1 Tax=Wansuia hejianensis TaxID=2763667 RepID=A0A926F0L2_9FIRM|nr:PspC domain-containing protein [Wansuia hejianensis]MBC8589704.1 PspC domain-containing protein [Wansuia hejianensis]
MEKKLYRSNENRMIAGVCGGIGEYFNIDPTIIRLIWAILSIPTAIFGAVFAYIIAMIIIPVKY